MTGMRNSGMYTEDDDTAGAGRQQLLSIARDTPDAIAASVQRTQSMSYNSRSTNFLN